MFKLEAATILFVVIIVFCCCEIETGYRVEISPIVDSYNKVMLAFSVFIKMEHPDKVDAEKDITELYHIMDEILTNFKALAQPEGSARREFHKSFTELLNFTLNMLDDYRKKINLEITLQNAQRTYADLSDLLATARTSYRTAFTARSKNTMRERITELAQEQVVTKKNLEDATEDYKENLAKLITDEEFLFNRYPDIVRQAKTSVLMAIFPPPAYIVSQIERDRYFPPTEIKEEK